MRVQSSHLALRFYRNDGWTGDVLRECLHCGETEFCPGIGLDYWRLTQNSSFDTDKLLKYVTQLDRWDGDDNEETDKQYIEGMNW